MRIALHSPKINIHNYCWKADRTDSEDSDTKTPSGWQL